MAFRLFLVLCLSFLCKITFAFQDDRSPFNDVLEDTASCSSSCEQTYPLHTYPLTEDLRACQRGCRLFSLLEFGEVEYEDSDYNATTRACKGACFEAYRNESQLFACCLGCTEQVPYAIQRRQEYLSEEATLHLLQPLFSMHRIFQQLTSSKGGVSFSSAIFFWQGDNDQVYIFETQPEIDIFTVDPDPQDPFNFAKPFSGFETNLEVLNDHDPTSDPNNKPYMMSHVDTSSWLDCVAKRSGLPRWLLSVTILLSSVALLWLCCATMVTAPERRVKVPKLSIYGDLDYLKQPNKSPNGHIPIYVSTFTATKSASSLPDDDDVEPLPLDIDIIPIQSKV